MMHTKDDEDWDGQAKAQKVDGEESMGAGKKKCFGGSLSAE